MSNADCHIPFGAEVLSNPRMCRVQEGLVDQQLSWITAADLKTLGIAPETELPSPRSPNFMLPKEPPSTSDDDPRERALLVPRISRTSLLSERMPSSRAATSRAATHRAPSRSSTSGPTTLDSWHDFYISSNAAKGVVYYNRVIACKRGQGV